MTALEGRALRAEVHEIALPPSARVLSTLARVDYADAFLLATPHAGARTAEEWARAMLEEAPAATRRMLRRSWCALGLRLGSTDDRARVLGWEVRRSSPESALLAGRSRMGIDAELLFKREPDGVLFATILTLGNPLARIVWTSISPRHRRVVRHLLGKVTVPTSDL